MSDENERVVNGETCCDCKFFTVPRRNEIVGECRKNPPVFSDAIYSDSDESDFNRRINGCTVYPTVSLSDWCGKWVNKKRIIPTEEAVDHMITVA